MVRHDDEESRPLVTMDPLFPSRDPDPEALAAIADSLVEEALKSSSPARSAAALIRHRYADRLNPSALHRLKAEVAVMLSNSLSRPPEDPTAKGVDAPWLTVKEAARCLRITAATLKQRLRSHDRRRELGWPWWDGHRWLIPGAALCPTRRAAFLCQIPPDEPYPPPPFADR